MRIASIYNQLVIFFPKRNLIHHTNMHRDLLNEFTENQMIVQEENGRIHPIPKPLRTEKFGFVKSFIYTVDRDYLFLYNPDSKDYFLHHSRIDFIPRAFDQISFYPTINLSKRHRKFPMATLVKKIGPGSYQQIEDNKADTLRYLKKIENEIELDKKNIRTQMIYARLLFNNGDYNDAIGICKNLTLVASGSIEPHFIWANCLHEQKKFKMAFSKYRRVYAKWKAEYWFVEKIVERSLEYSELEQGDFYCQDFFKYNEYTLENRPLLGMYVNILSQRRLYQKVEFVLENLPPELEAGFAASFIDLARQLSAKLANVPRALKFFDKGIQLERTENSLLEYAIFLYRIGDNERSDLYLHEAIQINKRPRDVRIAFAEAIGRIDFIQYIPEYIRPEFVDEKLALAKGYLSQKKIVEAVKIVQGLRKFNVTQPSFYALLNQIRKQIGLDKQQYASTSEILPLCYKAACPNHFYLNDYQMAEYLSFLHKQRHYITMLDILNTKQVHKGELHPRFSIYYAKAILIKQELNPDKRYQKDYDKAMRLLEDLFISENCEAPYKTAALHEMINLYRVFITNKLPAHIYDILNAIKLLDPQYPHLQRLEQDINAMFI